MAELSPTPTNGTQGPGQVWLEGGLKEAGKAVGVGNLESGWIDDLIRKHVLSHGSGLAAILTAIGSNVDDLLAVIVHFLDAVQAQNSPGFFTLMAELLSGIAGFEISADHVNAGWKRGGTYGGFTAVGQGYWDGMLQQIGAPQTITPQTGLKAAQGFLGYLLGFSIREGNLGLLMSFIPEEWRVLDGIEDYAKSMRSALGLGRMARQALHPLIQTLITDPLQWYVNQQYTPKTLGATQAIRAFNRGLITQDLYNQEIAYDGYTPERAEALLEETLEQLGNGELWTLFKYGNIDANELRILLKRRGMHPVDADRYATAQSFADADSAVSDMISVLKTQRLAGVIDDQQLGSQLQGLPISTEHSDRLQAAIGQQLSLPRQQLTVSELQYSYKAGDLGLDQFTARLTALGYSADDVQFLIRQAQQRTVVKSRYLSLSELEQAFNAGLLDLEEVDQNLGDQGYSDDDRQILLLLVLGKLATQEAKIAVAKYNYAKAVAKAEKAGEPTPPPPAILATGPI